MQIKICQSISEIQTAAWDNLVRDNHPFIKHTFLQALETHDCATAKFGWQACHVAVYRAEILVGACPLYIKTNSYGEFVFDQVWANFYQQHGAAYFPKLVSAIPYTPAIGQRLLCQPGLESEVLPLVLKTIKSFAYKIDASGFHALFLQKSEHQFLLKQDLMSRFDCQFHWDNENYVDFEEFLSRLKAKKRKNIRQERKKVKQQGVTFRVLSGRDATKKDWLNFSLFYARTFEEKSGIATLNLEFFQEVARTMPAQIILILADKDQECIAGALCYKSDTTLYGRHWGCLETIDYLHFEVCYYQGIEYCIKHGLQKFEPGAQGEYKLARGFLPYLTKSCHWLADNNLQMPILDFIKREQAGVLAYIQQMQQDSPYQS